MGHVAHKPLYMINTGVLFSLGRIKLPTTPYLLNAVSAFHSMLLRPFHIFPQSFQDCFSYSHFISIVVSWVKLCSLKDKRHLRRNMHYSNCSGFKHSYSAAMHTQNHCNGISREWLQPCAWGARSVSSCLFRPGKAANILQGVLPN